MTNSKRFSVALSFPGERRTFVANVAKILADKFGRKRILYDKYHEAELARVDLDVYLPDLYRRESELIVLFICAEYEKKRWCKLEWRSIRQLIATAEQKRIMLLSFDDIGAEIGILSGDGYALIDERTPEEIGGLIIERYEINSGSQLTQSPLETTPPLKKAGSVPQKPKFGLSLHKQLVAYANNPLMGLNMGLSEATEWAEQHQHFSQSDLAQYRKLVAYANNPHLGLNMHLSEATEWAEQHQHFSQSDLNQYRKLVAYANNPLTGLNMSLSEATEWAEKRMAQN